MTPRKLRENVSAIPYGPFDLRMSDGTKVRVPHRDYLLVSPDGEQVALYDDSSAFRFIDTFHITSVEFIRAEPPRKKVKGKAGAA